MGPFSHSGLYKLLLTSLTAQQVHCTRRTHCQASCLIIASEELALTRACSSERLATSQRIQQLVSLHKSLECCQVPQCALCTLLSRSWSLAPNEAFVWQHSAPSASWYSHMPSLPPPSSGLGQAPELSVCHQLDSLQVDKGLLDKWTTVQQQVCRYHVGQALLECWRAMPAACHCVVHQKL